MGGTETPDRLALSTEEASDAVLRFIVVCGLFSLSNKGVHALVGA